MLNSPHSIPLEPWLLPLILTLSHSSPSPSPRTMPLLKIPASGSSSHLPSQALNLLNNQKAPAATPASSGNPTEAGVILTNGVSFCSKGPRSDKELEETRILVTRAQRQELRDRICVPLPLTIQEIKWSDILDASTDADIRSAMIGVKTMMNDVEEFAFAYDLAYDCDIPLVTDDRPVG